LIHHATADSCFIDGCSAEPSLIPSPQAVTGQLPAFKMLFAAFTSAFVAKPQDRQQNRA
jgi:hypothetical protein